MRKLSKLVIFLKWTLEDRFVYKLGWMNRSFCANDSKKVIRILLGQIKNWK